MRLPTFCMIISSAITFYYFQYIDGFLLVICSTQWVLLSVIISCHASNYSKHQCDITQSKEIKNILYIRKCLFFASVGALFAYNSAFRMSLQAFSSSTKDLAESIPSTNIFFTLFSKYDVNTVANVWFSMLHNYISSDTASMIIALCTGQKEFMHNAFSDLFRRNGISHLLALSGFHLSLIIMGVQYMWNIVSRISTREFHRLTMEIISIILVWIYCLWIGFIPSLYRAVLMFSLSVLVRCYFGSSASLLVWTITGVILQFIKPEIMYSHGFILSMLALLGVYLGVHYSYYVCRIFPPIVAIPLSIGLGATLFTSWYSYVYFGASYPIGIVTSLLLTPFITLFMVGGIFYICLVYFVNMVPWFGIVAKIVGIGFDYFVDGMIILLSYLSRGIVIDSPYKLLLYYTVLISVILLYKKIIGTQHSNGNNRSIQYYRTQKKIA